MCNVKPLSILIVPCSNSKLRKTRPCFLVLSYGNVTAQLNGHSDGSSRQDKQSLRGGGGTVIYSLDKLFFRHQFSQKYDVNGALCPAHPKVLLSKQTPMTNVEALVECQKPLYLNDSHHYCP